MASVWVLKSTFRMIVSVAGIVDLNLNNGVQNSNSRSCFARHSFFYYLFYYVDPSKKIVSKMESREYRVHVYSIDCCHTFSWLCPAPISCNFHNFTLRFVTFDMASSSSIIDRRSFGLSKFLFPISETASKLLRVHRACTSRNALQLQLTFLA